jgi:hypothetical protein
MELRQFAQLRGALRHAGPRQDDDAQRMSEAGLQRRLEHPCCPICEEIAASEAQYFFWLLTENHGEIGVMDTFEASGGFCERHAARLTGKREAGAPMAHLHAYMSRGHQRRLGAELDTHSKGKTASTRPTWQCPACQSVNAASAHTAFFLSRLINRPEIRVRCVDTLRLCFPHLQLLLGEQLTRDAFRFLLSTHRAHLGALLVIDTARTASGTSMRTAHVDQGGVQPMFAALAGLPPAQRATARSRHELEPCHAHPLADLHASLSRTDVCPVCRVLALGWAHWRERLAAAADTGEDIHDLVPLAAANIWAMASDASPSLQAVLAASAGDSVLGQLSLAMQLLDPEEHPRNWRTRIASSWLFTGRRRHRNASFMAREPFRCPLDDFVKGTQGRTLRLLGDTLGLEPSRREYQAGHGLCLHHLWHALDVVPPGEVQHFLLRSAIARVACIGWELEEQGRKVAWSARVEAKGDERTAWLRALPFFSGIDYRLFC